jgi:hypothetical protein
MQLCGLTLKHTERTVGTAEAARGICRDVFCANAHVAAVLLILVVVGLTQKLLGQFWRCWKP